MNSKILPLFIISIFAIAFNAKSQTDSLELETPMWKAIYLEAGATIFPRGNAIGITLVATENFFVAGRVCWATQDAPQLPADYKASKSSFTYTGSEWTGNGGGGGSYDGWFDFGVISGINYNNGNADNSDVGLPNILDRSVTTNPLKKNVRMMSFTCGGMHNLSKSNLRIRAEGGIALMKITQPVNFKFVPASVEESVERQGIITTTEGYTYSICEENLTGVMVGAGLEFPIFKWAGLGVGFSAAFAKEEQLYTLSANLLFGILK